MSIPTTSLRTGPGYTCEEDMARLGGRAAGADRMILCVTYTNETARWFSMRRSRCGNGTSGPRVFISAANSEFGTICNMYCQSGQICSISPKTEGINARYLWKRVEAEIRTSRSPEREDSREPRGRFSRQPADRPLADVPAPRTLLFLRLVASQHDGMDSQENSRKPERPVISYWLT